MLFWWIAVQNGLRCFRKALDIRSQYIVTIPVFLINAKSLV